MGKGGLLTGVALTSYSPLPVLNLTQPYTYVTHLYWRLIDCLISVAALSRFWRELARRSGRDRLPQSRWDSLPCVGASYFIVVSSPVCVLIGTRSPLPIK